MSYQTLSTNFRVFTANLDNTEIPKNSRDALKILEWREAVMEEIRALEKNETWDMVKLPKCKRPVGCKWVFNVKYKTDGTIESYKARLEEKSFASPLHHCRKKNHF